MHPKLPRIAVSVIAARPTRVFKGNIHSPTDIHCLQTAIDAGPKLSGDHGFPIGGLCGWVDYEGEFVFGDYPEMLVFSHRDRTWWETGGLSTRLLSTESAAEISDFTPLAPREQFTSGVARIKEWIAAGHIYQANLSQAFAARVTGDPSALRSRPSRPLPK